MSYRLLLPLALVLFSVVGMVWLGTKKNIVYYYTVDEFLAQPTNRRVRISGYVKKGSIEKKTKQVRFILENRGKSLPVFYTGVIPDAFVEKAQAVVEGFYKEGTFEAETLMAKCPSKFESR